MALQLPPTMDDSGVTHQAPYLRAQTITITRGNPGSGVVHVEIIPALYASQAHMAAGHNTIKPAGALARRRIRLSKTPAVPGDWGCEDPGCDTSGSGMEKPASCPNCGHQVLWQKHPKEAVNEIPAILLALADLPGAIDDDLQTKIDELTAATKISND